MLEIKSISKTYGSKKGSACKALDDVSLRFQEKGLVFILGKSGSGKTTLLNVLGGLDKADKGEIIINGKSCNDFSAEDFDCYRNTVLGFVFQEFQLLNGFSVEDNIRLALRLQGKDSETRFKEVFDKVGLSGMEKRQVSELSGGQRQRVSIARAIIKNPQILLADEPTGNLDSKTTEQVFDILKEYSKQNLVVVVSHDKENAERYADRIVEIMDGRILSDVQRIGSREGFNVTQDNVSIPVNEVLSENKLDAIVGSVEQFGAVKVRKVNNAFLPTEQDKYVNQKSYSRIKAAMPLKYSLRITAANVAGNMGKMIFTVLLTIIALVLFGMSQALASYTQSKVASDTLRANNITTIAVKQGKFSKDFDLLDHNHSYTMTADNVTAVQQLTDKALPFYGLEWNRNRQLTRETSMELNYAPPTVPPSSLAISGAIVASYDDAKQLFPTDDNGDLIFLAGEYPQSGSGKFAIPDYLCDAIIGSVSNEFWRLYDDGYNSFIWCDECCSRYKLANYESSYCVHTGKNQLGLYDGAFTCIPISGVIYTGYAEEYGELIGTYATDGYLVYKSRTDYLKFAYDLNNLYSVLYAADAGAIDDYCDLSSCFYFYHYGLVPKDQPYPSYYSNPDLYFATTQNLEHFNASQCNSFYSLRGQINSKEDIISLLSTDSLNVFMSTKLYNSTFGTHVTATDHSEFTERECTFAAMDTTERKGSVSYDIDLKVIGVYSSGHCDVMASSEVVSYLKQGRSQLQGFMVTLPEQNQQRVELFNYLDKHDMYHDSELSASIYSVCNVTSIVKNVFLLMSGILMVFCVLMLVSFISANVIDRKKEIGILRALGARGRDVAGIFFVEGILIATLVGIVTVILMFFGIDLLNSILLNNYVLLVKTEMLIDRITLLKVEALPLIIVTATTYAITALSVLIPTIKLIRQTPISAIRD